MEAISMLPQTRRRIIILSRKGELAQSVRNLLSDDDFDIVEATFDSGASDALGRFDAVLVEADMDQESDRKLVGKLAIEQGLPVFVIGEEGEPTGADLAYEQGATDFTYGSHLGKDFSARLRHTLRRSPTRLFDPAPRLRRPRLRLFPEDRTCEVDGKRIHLTRHEQVFLSKLAQAPRHFCTHRELIDTVWGPDSEVETQYIRVLVSQVRRKIEQPDRPPIVRTVSGDGYRLEL